jgi:hypothetical protein
MRIGLVTFLAVTVLLILYSLWSFSHPAPCTPDQTHCDSEFSGDPAFRALTLGACVVAGLGCGLVAWTGSAFARRLSRRRQR